MHVGAQVDTDGVTYRVWAPKAHRMTVEIEPRGGGTRRLAMRPEDGGHFVGRDPDGRAGDAYGFSLGGPVFPDPASRAQQRDVYGKSVVVDPGTFVWGDQAWRRPAFRDLVIYEVHVGAFSEEGTFRAAIERLPALAALGVTAIQLMPIADVPGRGAWGYDGVLIYAPARAYGSPDDLRALVDAAHRAGLAVLLDVVYNHLGPDGNILGAYAEQYFCRRHHTPWGAGFNFDDAGNEAVRAYFLGNPLYWMEEFHFDGFRFDATHEIQDDSPVHILAEMTRAVHARGGYAVAEDFRNDVRVLDRDCGLGFDAVWADDFHHTVRVSQTRETFAYFQDFSGTIGEVVDCLSQGWIYRGQLSRFLGLARGTDGRKSAPACFVHCLSNHDQTGNRALGERLGALLEPSAYRMLSALLCLTPYTPMLFMGQEWGAGTPFLYFCDHHSELGRAVTEGRRREFASFPQFSEAAAREAIPDPQAEATFRQSKLQWEETALPPHDGLLRLHRACLELRARHESFRPPDRSGWSAGERDGMGFLSLGDGAWMLLFALGTLREVSRPEGPYEMVLSSEEARFGGSGASGWGLGAGPMDFAGPETVVVRRK